jgi:hypothetical protein
MTTVLDVIKRARRKLKVYDRAEELDTLDAEEGLESFKDFLKGLVATGALGKLTPVIISADYTAGENERIVNTSATPWVITLPQVIEADLTDPDSEDEDRPPRERAIVEIAGDNPVTWIYEARLGGWVSIQDLELTSEAPLSAAFGDELICRFALQIADENSAEPGPVTIASARRFMRAITASNDAPRPIGQTNYF